MGPGGPGIRVSVGKMQPAKLVSPIGPPAGAVQERVKDMAFSLGRGSGDGSGAWSSVEIKERKDW